MEAYRWSPFPRPRCAASRVGPDGNIWFPTDTLGVAHFTHRRGIQEVPLPGLGSFFSDLTAGPDHAVWVLGSDAVARVTVTGQTTYFPKERPQFVERQPHRRRAATAISGSPATDRSSFTA